MNRKITWLFQVESALIRAVNPGSEQRKLAAIMFANSIKIPGGDLMRLRIASSIGQVVRESFYETG